MPTAGKKRLKNVRWDKRKQSWVRQWICRKHLKLQAPCWRLWLDGSWWISQVWICRYFYRLLARCKRFNAMKRNEIGNFAITLRRSSKNWKHFKPTNMYLKGLYRFENMRAYTTHTVMVMRSWNPYFNHLLYFQSSFVSSDLVSVLIQIY